MVDPKLIASGSDDAKGIYVNMIDFQKTCLLRDVKTGKTRRLLIPVVRPCRSRLIQLQSENCHSAA